MTKPLDILFLKKSFLQKGGLEKQANLIVQGFASRGHNITIFTEDPNPKLDFETVICQKTQGPSFLKSLHYSKEAKKFVNQKKFDAVFSFDRTEEQSIMRLGNGLHKTYLEEKFRYLPWYKKILRKNPQDFATLRLEQSAFHSRGLETVITNSEMVKNELLQAYPVDCEKIHVIHNGVEWEENALAFEESFSLTPSELPFSYDPSKIQLLFLGHGFKRKGLDFLLLALAHLNRDDFHLHIVGHDKNLSFYHGITNKHSLTKSVTFHGTTSSSKLFYQIADLCIIPSIYDPFANVTVEALNFGCPVISSKKNGGSEILKKGMGLVIPDLNDDKELSKIIFNQFKKKNYSSASEIRKKIEHLDLKNQLSKLIDLCEKRTYCHKM